MPVKVDAWVVFGGWGAAARVLAPLFGPKARLIDCGSIVPHLIRDEVLASGWPYELLDLIAPELPAGQFGIAGWSAGALLAYALAREVEPAACVLISATPSFCRRPELPYGQKSLVLKAMRERLARDAAGVLRTFHARCGIDAAESASSPEAMSESPAFDRAALIAGLSFLEQATLLPVRRLPCPSLFLHGKDDSIVPVEAGKFFCRESGGTFAEVEGPHAFFMTRYLELAAVIKERLCVSLPERTCHEPL